MFYFIFSCFSYLSPAFLFYSISRPVSCLVPFHLIIISFCFSSIFIIPDLINIPSWFSLLFPSKFKTYLFLFLFLPVLIYLSSCFSTFHLLPVLPNLSYCFPFFLLIPVQIHLCSWFPQLLHISPLFNCIFPPVSHPSSSWFQPFRLLLYSILPLLLNP